MFCSADFQLSRLKVVHNLCYPGRCDTKWLVAFVKLTGPSLLSTLMLSVASVSSTVGDPVFVVLAAAGNSRVCLGLQQLVLSVQHWQFACLCVRSSQFKQYSTNGGGAGSAAPGGFGARGPPPAGGPGLGGPGLSGPRHELWIHEQMELKNLDKEDERLHTLHRQVRASFAHICTPPHR